MNIFLSKYFIACVSEVFIILGELFRFFARIRFNEFVSLLNVAWVNEGFDLFDDFDHSFAYFLSTCNSFFW